MNAGTLIAAGLLALTSVQPSQPTWLKAASRVSITATLEPERPGDARAYALLLEVTPQPGVHVYAPGNPSYSDPDVQLDLPAGVRRAGPPAFPDAVPLVFGESKEIVQVYASTFRVRQRLTLDRGQRRNAAVRVAGTLDYQACTSKICFPPQSEPFEVTLPASPPSPR